MKTALQLAADAIALREEHCDCEVRVVLGTTYVIGYPKPSHPFCGAVRCFVWTQQGEDKFSWHEPYETFPEFLNHTAFTDKGISLEEVEQALDIMGELK